MEKTKIGGIMQSEGRSLLRVMAVPDSVGVAGHLFSVLGESSVNLELIVESYDLDEAANFCIVIAQKDLDLALTILDEIKPELRAGGVSYNPDVAIISVFGPHLREKPRIPGLIFSALASVGVAALAISTSISSVSCVVEGSYLNDALEALSEVFDAPFQVKKRPKDY